MAVSYGEYLKLDQLLALQSGLEGDESRISADELHFIVVHQTFELWFKVILRELRLASERLDQRVVREEEIPHVVHHLERIHEIFQLGAQQWRVMETLATQDFLAFRDKLVPASGFQSFQLRELEIALGLADESRQGFHGVDPLDHLRGLAARSPGEAQAWSRLEAARGRTSLLTAVRRWLYRAPIRGSGPDDPADRVIVETFVADYLAAVQAHQRDLAERMAAAQGRELAEILPRFSEGEAAARRFLNAEDAPAAEREWTRRVRAALVFVESYRDLPLLAWPRALLDRLVALEQGMIVWRSRHARMVERVIGRRVGTGGSAGVDYLDGTASYRVFQELWTVRTLLLPRERLPRLEGREQYGFAPGGPAR
jgi:tryptophan 2,3-dioxygenase